MHTYTTCHAYLHTHRCVCWIHRKERKERKTKILSAKKKNYTLSQVSCSLFAHGFTSTHTSPHQCTNGRTSIHTHGQYTHSHTHIPASIHTPLPHTQELTSYWEIIRQHNTTKEKRSQLVTTAITKSTGRVAELAASHVTSRVLQACAKYGTGAQRAALLQEVMPEFVSLAKSPYGHFMLRKLVATAPRATVPGVFLCVSVCFCVGGCWCVTYTCM